MGALRLHLKVYFFITVANARWRIRGIVFSDTYIARMLPLASGLIISQAMTYTTMLASDCLRCDSTSRPSWRTDRPK
eukprot:scaffold549600_cov18-Prasinocladus_malaysianus.AAC.1